MKRYDPKTIEPKWQQIWAETKLYEVHEDSDKPKSYVLDFFPYPSGVAMHVGHVRNYTISDALSRYRRLKGENVLHPMGWDAFGLPAENFAIKTGISPRQATDQNKAMFKQQLMKMGMSYDWTRELDSTDPKFYRWTQWFFTFLLERGLAYQKESEQWWCETDQTVLANEQVEAGRCWRCHNLVTKKTLKQWFFKITDYADRLLADLDDIDWPEGIKTMQRNWIGRSSGARATFAIEGHKDSLQIFTTRIDTIYGATFMVLAPEHQLLATITTPAQKAAVEAYTQATFAKSDIERMETDREKTGVFTGAYAINPATGGQLPIWVADYVLIGYGTGAIMAVPGHDARDQEFARKFDLPIIPVVRPVTGKPQEDPEYRQSIVAILRNPKDNTYLSINWGNQGGNIFIGGGRETGETAEQTALREITEETGYQHVKHVTTLPAEIEHHYYAHSKGVARRIDVVSMLFELTDTIQVAQALEADEAGKFTVEWLTEAEIAQKVTDELHLSSFQQLVQGQVWTGEGIMMGSGQYDGQSSAEAREAMLADFTKAGWATEQVNYRMRDWLISRQRYWGAPIPVIHCEKCGTVAVPADQLPVELPEISDYQPSGDGRSPLAKVADWVNVPCPQCGGPAQRETDTMDGFACSSWYFLRFADPYNDQAPFDRAKADYWLPVDTYIGGAEHAVMHLLYARFWTKVMADGGLIGFTEPFTALRNQGMILAPDGRKMSKSYGNTITPDEIIEQNYGADALRLYELFIAPYEQTVPWSVQGIDGSSRFLHRAWSLVQDAAAATGNAADHNGSAETRLVTVLHKTIRKVTADLESMAFNTAIAALMEFVNEAYKLKVELPIAPNAAIWQGVAETLTILLAPYAPHITEELWADLGHSSSVHSASWPAWDAALIIEDVMTIAVQINGKVRATVAVAPDATESDIIELALADAAVVRNLEGRTPTKTIFVPGKIVNFVVS